LNEKGHSLTSGHEFCQLVTLTVRELINLAENDGRGSKTEFPLPTILITLPQGKTVIVKDKKHRNWRNWTNKQHNLRHSRGRKSNSEKLEAEE